MWLKGLNPRIYDYLVGRNTKSAKGFLQAHKAMKKGGENLEKEWSTKWNPFYKPKTEAPATEAPPPPEPKGIGAAINAAGAKTVAGGGNAEAQGNRLNKSRCNIEILRKLAKMCKTSHKKWPVPGLVPPSGEKGVGGQKPLEKKQGVPKGVDPKKHESCVKQVKAEGKVDNPWAVCNASLQKGIGEDAKNRTAAYAKKHLGAWQRGEKTVHLFNEASHPEHSGYDTLDHMRASAKHTEMANNAESNKLYYEAAHHRKQAAEHKAKYKAMLGQKSGSLYKSLMDATKNKGSSPMRETLNTGEKTRLEKAQYAKTELPEDRQNSKDAKKANDNAMKRLGQKIRKDTIKYLKNQRGTDLSSENPKAKDRAKSSLRGVKDKKLGEQFNKPE